MHYSHDETPALLEAPQILRERRVSTRHGALTWCSEGAKTGAQISALFGGSLDGVKTKSQNKVASQKYHDVWGMLAGMMYICLSQVASSSDEASVPGSLAIGAPETGGRPTRGLQPIAAHTGHRPVRGCQTTCA